MSSLTSQLCDRRSVATRLHCLGFRWALVRLPQSLSETPVNSVCGSSSPFSPGASRFPGASVLHEGTIGMSQLGRKNFSNERNREAFDTEGAKPPTQGISVRWSSYNRYLQALARYGIVPARSVLSIN